MTATLHKLGAGGSAGLYYTNDSARESQPSRRDEYYSRDGGGTWWTSGESVVRHGASVDAGSFRDLCAGIDPRTGKPLVRGAGEGHWAGVDLTFTAAKSVSVLWMSGSAQRRAMIEAAHAQAVDRALRFALDEGLIVVRQGAGGVEKAVPSDLIVAKFPHFTNRQGDPNIHTHCVIMNVAAIQGYKHNTTVKYLTTDPEKLFRWQLAVGAAYRAALAERLASLGLAPRPAGRGQWEVAGLPQELLERFSKRSHEIEAAVGREATAAQKEVAALRTRGAKQDMPTGAELEQRWRRELAEAAVDPWAAALDHAPERDGDRSQEPSRDDERDAFDPPEIEGPEAAAIAASALFRHESVVERRQFLERTFVECALQSLGPDHAYEQMSNLEATGRIFRLSDTAWTTPTIAACEAAMLRAADRPQERQWIAPGAVEAALTAAPHLSAEQREAVAEAARSDGASVVEAAAGTGKTTLARALVDAAQRSGLKVIGVAPSWVAADELSRSIGVESVAIARWRHDIAAGRVPQLDASSMIVVDEAGMIGTRDLSAILTAAKAGGAKVVLIGDRRQLASVAGASALKAVAEVVRRGALLDAVRRQAVDWQRAASVLMARGDAEAGLRAYARRGRMELIAGEMAARDRAVAVWTELRAKHGEGAIIITRRNKDSAVLNQFARAALKAERHLTGPEVELPALDREGERGRLALTEGDRVRFGEDLPHFGVRNGSRATIEAIRRAADGGATLAFAFEDGRRIVADWAELTRPRPDGRTSPPRVVHAYAVTAYSTQGRTTPASVLYLARQTEAREIYVGLTRHTHDARIIVESDRLDALCRQRQTDHRLKPTTTAMKERLFTEARKYRDKANVVDFCDDREEFMRTGLVAAPAPDTPARIAARYVLAARALCDAMLRLAPGQMLIPIWRLVDTGRTLHRELAPKLAEIVRLSHAPRLAGRTPNALDRGPSHERWATERSQGP